MVGSRLTRLEPRFVKFIPKPLDEGVLYVSVEYEVTVHLCPCGCGHEVVVPIGDGGWTMTVTDGLVDLHPSILNSFPCRSHYWIRGNEVVWA